MRLRREKIEINYKETQHFFQKRAQKYNMENPYSVTMYQDNNPELVKERNKVEVSRLRPLLHLTAESRVLDVACGIGRWADAILEDIDEYCGVDFSKELIEIANKRNNRNNFAFYEGSISEIDKVLLANGKGKYNTVLMVGIVMYLNDNDLFSTLNAIEKVCEEHTVLCVREPIGISERLTLKDFYSDELQDNYNAIYRTREEFKEVFEATLFKRGFSITKEGFVFNEPSLNNRKETSQYYYIIER
ncbi:MAG: class I SAM-dependent methyltransferase [Lachnospiraceae bacterium]|nr:class I SAM-dependent methyltransferase [Lachnospiraceae bacterium]